jgi:ubiquinone/menaquinone biosynthesis C-methylase UbiE
MYHPETYWNDVAKRIAARQEEKRIAGDDEPYYRYKRNKFLSLLCRIDFKNKTVLEVGSGPGGNLVEVLKQGPKEMHGVDIADDMIAVSRQLVREGQATISKINGEKIPYPDQYFDISFTSTVLQHNTDESMLHSLMNEIIRVTGQDIYLFEKIEKKIRGTENCVGRPVSYYRDFFEARGFALQEVVFLNIKISYLVSGAIRKLFNNRSRKEGEPVSALSSFLQKSTLPLTAALDKLFRSKRNVAMMHFTKSVKTRLPALS